MNSSGSLLRLLSAPVRNLGRILVPHVCPVCKCALVEGEELLCLKCITEIPRTNYHHYLDNSLVRRLIDLQAPVDKAASFFFYTNHNPFSRLIRDAKYQGLWLNNLALAHLYARELLSSDFLDNIDLIIPVPIHWYKQYRRGYNQTEYIARGISDITGIPVATNLRAVRPHKTQTKKTSADRASLSADIFRIDNPSALAGRNILLVDDVITTGSTILTCARTLYAASRTPLSILSLSTPIH